jgi:hypothetical protein
MTRSLVDRPLHFEPLGDRSGDVWRRPRQFSFLDRVGAVPLSDSELLQTSLYLPLAVQEAAGTHQVVAVVHPDFLARSPVRGGARWGQFYMPIALRCLPFRRAGQARGSISSLEMATDLDVGDDATVLPLFAENGRLHQDLAGVVSLLERLERGKAALARVAAALVAADLLVPLVSTNPENALAIDVELLVIDPRRLRSLTPARTVALAANDFLALDLATALAFSSRLWASNLAPGRSADDAEIAPTDPALFGQHAQAAFAIELRIDDSSLFSVDTFVKSGKPSVDPGC